MDQSRMDGYLHFRLPGDVQQEILKKAGDLADKLIKWQRSSRSHYLDHPISLCYPIAGKT